MVTLFCLDAKMLQWCRSLQHHAILAAKEPTLTGSHLGGQLMDAEAIHPTHTLVSPCLSIWGLIPLLNGYVMLVRNVSTFPSPKRCRSKACHHLPGGVQAVPGLQH